MAGNQESSGISPQEESTDRSLDEEIVYVSLEDYVVDKHDSLSIKKEEE